MGGGQIWPRSYLARYKHKEGVTESYPLRYNRVIDIDSDTMNDTYMYIDLPKPINNRFTQFVSIIQSSVIISGIEIDTSVYSAVLEFLEYRDDNLD